MSAYEAYEYSSKELATIGKFKQAIAQGAKEKDLPLEIRAHLTQENIDRFTRIQKNAQAQLQIELKQWE